VLRRCTLLSYPFNKIKGGMVEVQQWVADESKGNASTSEIHRGGL
jgi:hypothetical protein